MAKERSVTGHLDNQKLKKVPEDAIASNLATVSAGTLKVDYDLATWTEFQSFQQELATEEVEQWVRSEQYNTELREKLDTLEKTEIGVKFYLGRKLWNDERGHQNNVSQIDCGHQVLKHLSARSEITLILLDIYADYLRKKDPKVGSRIVRAILTTWGKRNSKYSELNATPY